MEWHWHCILGKAGHPLTVYNRTASKAQPLVDAGATYVDSPAEVARASDVVCTMVGFPADVRRVILDGDDAILPSLKPGALLVDFTTTEPALAKEMAEVAAARGCGAVDAPVSGGDAGARNAALSIMCGAHADAYESALPLLRVLGTPRLMGAPGAGQQTKMGNQIAIATCMVGTQSYVSTQHLTDEGIFVGGALRVDAVRAQGGAGRGGVPRGDIGRRG